MSDEEIERLNVGTYDVSNVAIKRELGKWRFIGKILPKNMNEDGEEFNIGISMAYGVLVIAICYVALGIIFKLDKKRFI